MQFSTLIPTAIAVFTLTSTVLSTVIPAPASLPLTTRGEHGIVPFPFDESDSAEIENALAPFESVPDALIQSGDSKAIKDWIQTHQPPFPHLTVRNDGSTPPALPHKPRQIAITIFNCAFAILRAIAENVFPEAKVARVAELVKALGGARKVAKMLLRAKTFSDLITIGGPELVELAEIFLGISDIAQACFSLFS